MSKKFFGKRSIAVLSALAILVSLVAMLAGLSLTSSAAYTPTRTVSITGNSSNTGAKMGIINSANVIGSNVTYTVKGYYKVEGFTGVTGQVAYGFICHGTGYSTPKYAIYGNNDWTPFEFTGVTSGLEANSAQWIMFGFVNAYGTISVADVTMTNSSGSQIYSMASDTALTNGTSSNVVNRQLGMWYFTAPTVTVAAGSGSSSGGSSSSLSLSASATTVATEEKITLTATGGATSIVISRVDGQWNNTYSGSSISLGFGWAGEYTAYATDGTNKSNSVNFTVGSSTPTGSKPTSATIGADKSVYKIGTDVIFSLIGDGETNTLWIYKPDGTSEYFQNAGTSYTYTPTQAGQYEALMETWNGVGSFCSERIRFRVVDPNAPTTMPSTTKPTTQSTTQPTTTKPTTQSTTQTTTTQPTTPPTTISTTAPTTVSTTAPTTVSTQGNPCAKGHKYQNGYCIYCAKKDPNWYPCINGHTFQNGFCVYCLAEDPTYDPCAGGHTYQDGWCVYCLDPDPNNPCARGEHNYVGGSCTGCFGVDPNYQNPCAAGHDLDENGSCKNCNYYDPDFDPDATQPTKPADKDTGKVSSKTDSGNDFWLWFWIALVLFIAFVVVAVLLIVKKNKSSGDTPAAE